jgi:hypothetical protein
MQTTEKETKRRLTVIKSSKSLTEAALRLDVSANSLGNWLLRRGTPASSLFEPEAPRPVDRIAAEHREARQEAVRKSEDKAVKSRLVQLEADLSFMVRAPDAAPRIVTPRSRPKSGKRIATPIFLLSDLHFGESVSLEESLGKNEYNLAIAAKRMRKCWDNMLWLRSDMARTQTCDDTLVMLNGDIVSGDIHPELQQTNDGGLSTQCDAAFDALYPGLVEMAEATPGTLHAVCIGGNHGRLTHKSQIKNGWEHSAEHLGVYGPLRKTIGAGRKGNIVWHIPPAERYIFEAHGRRLSQQHGHMIRS